MALLTPDCTAYVTDVTSRFMVSIFLYFVHFSYMSVHQDIIQKNYVLFKVPANIFSDPELRSLLNKNVSSAFARARGSMRYRVRITS